MISNESNLRDGLGIRLLQLKKPSVIVSGLVNSRILRACLEAYLLQIGRIWNHLPASLRLLPPGQMFGKHLHNLVRLHARRKQYFATFFLRNRPELELMQRILDRIAPGSNLDISVLACSKGAEVYSMLWMVRSARPDLRIRTNAVDISQEILEFAQKGVYARSPQGVSEGGDVVRNTARDQNASIFERMTSNEVKTMFEVEADRVKVRPWLREGITWLRGDVSDPDFIGSLGPQDIVVANRFLCHMEPAAAEKCLCNIARLVKPGGYLFVSGIDLDVRTKIARQMGWRSVTEMIREVHEGDVSLRRGWPLEYWGLEPLFDNRPDWKIRYASVFQIGEAP